MRNVSRPVMRLNGAWRTTAEDRAAFSRPDFDDSGWTNVSLPMKSSLPSGAGRTRWFRKNFTLPGGRAYDTLWLSGLRDAAEIWLNGMRLRDPAMLPPLDSMFFGVYDRLWPVASEMPIPVGPYLRARGRNVLAMRIAADDERWGEADSWADGPGEQAPGVFGEVSLQSRPDPWISSVERRAALVNQTGAQVDHSFYVVLNSGAIRTINVDVALLIVNDSGSAVARLNTKRALPPGGDIVRFTWRADASFTSYQARVALVNDDGRTLDGRMFRFHGISVAAERGRLFLNGEPFTLRGVNGLPGLTYGEKKNIFREAAVDDDLKRLSAAGFNAVRTSAPPPALLNEAVAAGMMVVPVLTGKDYARQVVALHESPEILFWDATGADRETASHIAAFVRAMDPYRRPVAGAREISGELNGYPCIGGRNQCPSIPAGADAPSFFTQWGAAFKGAPIERVLREMDFLQRTWDAGTNDNQFIGAFYRNLGDYASGAPGLRGAAPSDADARFLAMWPAVFSDLRVRRVLTGRDNPAISIEPAVSATIRNLDVILAGPWGTMRAAGGMKLERGDQSVIPLKPGATEARISYELYRGLKRHAIVPLGRPAWDPGALRPTRIDWTVRPGGKVDIQLSAHNPVRSEVWAQVAAPKPPDGFKIEPASRRMNIAPDGTLRADFTITASKKAKPGAVPLRFDLRFEDAAGTPAYAWALIMVK